MRAGISAVSGLAHELRGVRLSTDTTLAFPSRSNTSLVTGWLFGGRRAATGSGRGVPGMTMGLPLQGGYTKASCHLWP